MIDRSKRRALAPCGHVGAAEVEDHVDPEPGGEALPVAELAGPALGRPMEQRVAMEADDIDVAASGRQARARSASTAAACASVRSLSSPARSCPGPSGARTARSSRARKAESYGTVTDGPVQLTVSPSVSSAATSTPSIDVPLINPIARHALAMRLSFAPVYRIRVPDAMSVRA